VERRRRYFVGNAMQVMAAAWMMVELTGSDFLAAAVQTAVFLPMFLLALPAGVLADTTDRRRLILASLLTRPLPARCWRVLLFAGWAGPGTLMLFVFIAGCCTALLSPAYNSSLADAVPREELPQAITLVGLAYNAARRSGRRWPDWCSRSGAHGTSCSASSARCCWPRRSGAGRRRRIRRRGFRPSGCGAAC
jgi:hypothetical protein